MANQDNFSKYMNELETINELLDRVDPQKKIYSETKTRVEELREIITSLPPTPPSQENSNTLSYKKIK